MGKELEIGQKASFSKTISESDVYGFAGLSGDFNPAHVNQMEAEKGIFGKRIAHGFFGWKFDFCCNRNATSWARNDYMSQTMQFKRPVYFNDTVTATVEVSEIINKAKGIYRLATQVHNQNGDCVIDGEAVVKYLG